MDTSPKTFYREIIDRYLIVPDGAKYGTAEYVEEVAAMVLSCNQIAIELGWDEQGRQRITNSLLSALLPLVHPVVLKE